MVLCWENEVEAPGLEWKEMKVALFIYDVICG
jgi:hypothetical protein